MDWVLTLFVAVLAACAVFVIGALALVVMIPVWIIQLALWLKRKAEDSNPRV